MKPGLLVLVVSLYASVVLAQLNRSAVSINGLDSNPCSVASPCRSVAQALSQTNAGGELIVLDSAGYGGFTVTKTVSIEAPVGVYAGMTVTSGTAITIAAGGTDRVVLRGLTLNGLGTAANGVVASGGLFVHIENCVIDGFTQYGVSSTVQGLSVQDTTIRHCGSGVVVAGSMVAFAIGMLERVQIKDVTGGGAPFYFGAGILALPAGVVTARDTNVMAATYGFVADGGQLSVESCLATGNAYGIWSGAHNSGSLVKVSDTITTLNGTGWYIDGGQIGTWGNNRNRDNFTPDHGSPTTLTMN